jgi:hypothetical protein
MVPLVRGGVAMVWLLATIDHVKGVRVFWLRGTVPNLKLETIPEIGTIKITCKIVQDLERRGCICSETHSIEQKLCVRDLSKSQLTSCKIATTKHGRANQISDHLSRSCKISWDFGRSFEMCKSAPILEVSWDILQDVKQKGYGNAQIRDLSSKDPQNGTFQNGQVLRRFPFKTIFL